MSTKRMGIGVAVLAALTLATGSTSAAQADEGPGRDGRKAGHDIIVKGDHNQIVLGDDNVVAQGDISRESEAGEGDEDATAPTPPYATVHKNVAYLSERSAPRATASEVARFGPSTQVPISCYVRGEDIHGNTTWYRVRDEGRFKTGYVAAYYTDLTGAVSPCPTAD